MRHGWTRCGWILLALLLVVAPGSRSEELQSTKDFFPRQGIAKTLRCTSGTGPNVRQTYREGARFRDEDATALVEELTTPDGKTEHSIYYYRVLDDRWQQDYTERTVFPSGRERRVRYSTAFVVHGRETITIAGKTYDCWKIASEIKRDGKRTSSAVSWIAKRFGTVRKTAWFPKGKAVEHEMETFRTGGGDDGSPKSPGPGRMVNGPRSARTD